MNSVVRQNVICEIFHKISDEAFLCKRCFTKEIYCRASNEQEMLIHIYYKHRGFWNSSIFLPSSILEHVRGKLYECDRQSMAKCAHCGVIFYNATQRVLHHHIKTRHSTILLAFSLANL